MLSGCSIKTEGRAARGAKRRKTMTVPTEPEIPRLFEFKAMDMESPAAKGAHTAKTSAVSNVR